MTVYWRVEPDTKFPEDRIDEVRVGHGFVSGYLDASDNAAVVSLRAYRLDDHFAAAFGTS